MLTIVVLTVAAVSFLAPDPVERAETKFQQIKKGMTKAQVTELMGHAGWDVPPLVPPKGSSLSKWKFGGDNEILVVFDADLRVVEKRLLEIDPRTFFERIRDEIQDWITQHPRPTTAKLKSG